MTDSTTQAGETLAPVRPGDRILMLDILRGWAVLGILAVNALSFAWPMQVYMDPSAAPFALTGNDRLGMWVTDVFFHDKFRSLFSMLFGVSVFLVGGERGDDARGALLRRRLLFLGLFGLIHGVAIWYGDILLHYAYTGLLMMLVRSWPARRLLWIGGGVSLLWGIIAAVGALVVTVLPPEVQAQMAEGGPQVDAASIIATVERVRGDAGAAMLENLKAWAMLQGFSLFLVPITLPLMMLGLGLFKSGWLAGRGPTWTYLAAIAAGAANLAVLGHYQWQALGVDGPMGGPAEAAGGFAVIITLGYAAMLILLTRIGLRALTGVFAPVGRMAFSNYLSQSLIMASLFYMPWGPRLYGEWGPGMLWFAVGGVWLLQLIWSPLWLSRFQMGPMEWLWRCLSYGRWVPLLKRG